MRVGKRGSSPRSAGRVAARFCSSVRELILSGRVRSGDFLPPERQLAVEHGLAPSTVHRALKVLEAERLIAAEPRQGYRVLGQVEERRCGWPVAFLSSRDANPEDWSFFGSLLLESTRNAAERKGWPLLVATLAGRSLDDALRQVRSARAIGLIVDTYDFGVVDAVKDAGLPTVLISAWFPGAKIDAIMQDGQFGCRLAARHLVECGCRRIGWFGGIKAGDNSEHEQDRFGGAVAGLAAAGRDLPPALRVEPTERDRDLQAREFLSRRDRPDGIIAPWYHYALAIKRAADELGLRLGRDLELVGWCPEELYEVAWLPEFAGGAVPPAITWSVDAATETAMVLLAERRENPSRRPLRIKIPAGLRFAEGVGASPPAGRRRPEKGGAP